MAVKQGLASSVGVIIAGDAVLFFVMTAAVMKSNSKSYLMIMRNGVSAMTVTRPRDHQKKNMAGFRNCFALACQGHRANCFYYQYIKCSLLYSISGYACIDKR